MQKRNQKAKADRAGATASEERPGMDAMGSIFQASVVVVGALKSISSGRNGVEVTSTDAMSMVANQMKGQQFASEKEMYDAQNLLGAPTTKLASGEDVREPAGNCKRHYQNRLK